MLYRSAADQKRFRYYTSGQQSVALYKLSDGRSNASGISFVNASYTFELGDDDYNAFAGQTASLPDGNQAVITYSMSGDDIGMIDSATGEILLDDETVGTATVTATATASGNYRAGSTTYTITITPKVSTLSEVTAVSTYSLKNITVMAVDGNNAILHDVTGNKLLYKSSHGLTAGKFFNSVTATTTTYAARDILQITEFSDAVFGDNVEVNHGVAAELTSSMFDSEVRFIHAVGTKSDRTISVAGAGDLYLTSTSAVEDGPVEIYGYTVGYHTTNEVLYIIATDLQVYVDPDDPVLLLDGASSNVDLDWEFDATDPKTVEITVNANGSYTKTEATMDDWATVTLVDGTLTVTPKSTNSNVAPNSGTITITHNVDGSLVRTITCTQGGFEDLTTATATFTGAASGGMTGSMAKQTGVRRNVTAVISSGLADASNDHIRIYKDATLTISVPSGAKITHVEFDVTEDYSLSNLSNLTAGEWDGNAESVSFTASSQVRVDAIRVTYKIATSSLAYYTPTINAVDKSIYTDDEPVAIGATSDSPGAISYSIKSGSSYISLNSSTGVVTPLAIGTAVVTVSIEAYGDYESTSKDISVTVSERPLGTLTTKTLSMSYSSHDGWTITGTTDSSGSTKYYIMKSEAVIESPSFSFNSIKSVKVKTRTYSSKANTDVYYGDTKLGTITATGTSLADKTLTITTSPAAGTGTVQVRAGSDATSSQGAGVQEVTITYDVYEQPTQLVIRPQHVT